MTIEYVDKIIFACFTPILLFKEQMLIIIYLSMCILKLIFWSELTYTGDANWYFLYSIQLFVWNQHSTQPVLKYCEHTAAVKAIAWSPHLHGLLASGGGTADRCIRFWNTTTNSHLSCMDTGSQVILSIIMHLHYIHGVDVRVCLSLVPPKT